MAPATPQPVPKACPQAIASRLAADELGVRPARRAADGPCGACQRGLARVDHRQQRHAAASLEVVNGAYEAWNNALAKRYFSPSEAGKPVYLSVDDDALEELLPAVGGEGPAPESLAAAVRPTLRDGDAIFVNHLVWRTAWRRGGATGPPPYLALLALCVLAASRMARDPVKGIERTAYYPQLNPLLDRPRSSGMPPGFEQVDDLWNDLRTWLDDDLSGERGTSTATTHHFFRHIGWPISQCLLREADRRRLTEFFRAVGLEPHMEIERAQLWTLLRNWAREGCGLSEQALRIIRSAQSGVADQIAEIVKREFDVWEGELVDAQGRRRGDIALVLEIAQGGRQIAARLVPRKLDGFPERGRWALPDGREIEITAASEDWYCPLALKPAKAILEGGISLTSDRFALAYEPSPAVPLRASFGVGAWASVRQATVMEEHCIVTTDSLLPQVRDFLNKYADSGWRVLDRRGDLPAGWRIVDRVRITRAVPQVADALRRLAPRLHTATRLVGGLEIAPDQYLRRGEPDLWITVEHGDRAEIELDGRVTAVPEGVHEIHLSELDPPLPAGEHRLAAGGIRRRFSTFDGFPLVAPAGAGSLGHVIERHRTYRPSSTDAEALLPGGPRRGQIYVCGASAKARPEDLPEPAQPPVLVPAGFRAYTILGARPGEILSLLPPPPPRWLRDIELSARCQFFDQPVPFEPVWLILDGKLGIQVRPLRDPPAEPDLMSGLANAERTNGAAAAWCSAITAAAGAGARPRSSGDVWDRFVAVAS